MANTTTQYVIIRKTLAVQTISEETWTPISWDTVVENIGRNWGWSSSGVVIPETGIYMVIFHTSTTALSALSLKAAIAVDGTRQNGAVFAVTSPSSSSFGSVPAVLTILSLTKGEVVTGHHWFSYPTNNDDQTTNSNSIFYPTLQVIRC